MALSEVLAGGRVKGSLIRTHLAWLTDTHGAEAAVRVATRVGPATAALLASRVQPIAWYPFSALVETDQAIAAEVGGRAANVIADLGRYSARQHVTPIAPSPSGPHHFFADSARVHTHFVDFGRAEYMRVGPTAGRFSLLDYRCFSPVLCWSGLGYYTQAIELRGGRAPRIDEVECLCRGGEACRFDVRWS